MSVKLDIKPLSVNAAWQGRRFKTQAYKDYESAVLLMLPKMMVPKKSDLHVFLEFGFSNKACDIDNPVKPILDILQKKYGFDDKQIVELSVRKKTTKKGDEYVNFFITEAHTL